MTLLHCRILRSLPIAAAMTSLLCLSFGTQAQGRNDEEEVWQENAAAPPTVFSTERLHAFEVSKGSALSYGIDPATLSVGSDKVVRYVLVARSQSGALNVLYQGIRCQTGEVKTYGRWDNRASWNTNPGDTWQALSFSGATRPAMLLARGGVCDGRTITGQPREILRTLSTGREHTLR